MKTLLITLAVIIICSIGIQTNAQTFGVKGGLSLANVLDKDEDGTYSDDFKMKPGFHVGGIVDFPISEIFSLETGLLLNCKGFTVKDEYGGADYKANTNLLYLDIPITLKGGTDLNEKVRLYGILGPYIGTGLKGKIKVKVDYQGNTETEKEDLKWGNDENDDHIKRLDLGLTFGGGVEINDVYQISIAYDLGLSNNSPYTDYGTTFKNRVLRFSFAYLFVK